MKKKCQKSIKIQNNEKQMNTIKLNIVNSVFMIYLQNSLIPHNIIHIITNIGSQWKMMKIEFKL